MLAIRDPLADSPPSSERVSSGAAATRRGARRRHGSAQRAARPAPAAVPEAERHERPRDRLVAIVATSDDGGSSGQLRAEFNMIPPGDIRNCLAALSDNHSQIADIFQYPVRRRRRPERPRDRQPR